MTKALAQREILREPLRIGHLEVGYFFIANRNNKDIKLNLFNFKSLSWLNDNIFPHLLR